MPSFAVAAALVALLATPCLAARQKYHVNVFPDRRQPTWSVPVDDFRVNETIIDEGGVQYIVVRGPEGNFKVPFKDIAEIQFIRLVGYMQSAADVAIFETRIVGHTPDMVRYGTVWLRVMLGFSGGQPWYLMPRTASEKGTYIGKIAFAREWPGERTPAETPDRSKGTGEPIQVPGGAGATRPPTAGTGATGAGAGAGQGTGAGAAGAGAGAGKGTGAGAAGAGTGVAEDPFARMTLDELNAKSPLVDPLFDFDKSDVRPDAQQTLATDAQWLKAHPTTKIELFGYCDPRGTNEYNLTLGEQRATAAMQFLLSQGVGADRMVVVSKGKTQMFCQERTEACYQQNRRVHFVFTAK